MAASPPTLSEIILCFLFNIHTFPRRSLFAVGFQFLLSLSMPNNFFQCSLFKVRYSMFATPFAIRCSPSHSPHNSLSLFNVLGRFPYKWNIFCKSVKCKSVTLMRRHLPSTLASNENATLLFFFLKLYYFTQIHPIYVTYSIDIYQHIPTNKISKLWHQLYFITLL